MESKKQKSFKYIIEWIAVLPMLILLVVFIARIFMHSEKPFASELIWSEDAKKSYNCAPNDFVIYSIPSIATSKGLDYMLSGNPISDTTNYTITNIVYFESVKELQFTVKYPVKDLKDKNVLKPYNFVLEDDQKNRYIPSNIEIKQFTGYVYCRVTVDEIDIFKTNSIGFLIENNGKIIDARLMYNTLDRIGNKFSIYSLAYSAPKYKLSFIVRLPVELYKEDLNISLSSDNSQLLYNLTEIESNGKYKLLFIEVDKINLENYKRIDFSIDESKINIYDIEKDKKVYDDLSTESYELSTFYEYDRNILITPVKKIEFKPPKINN